MDTPDYLRAFFALAFTLSLMGLCAWVLARYGRNLPLMLNKVSPTSRLSVIESRMIDARHRLVLVRRDNTEHLLLLASHAAPVVVESNTGDKPS